MSLLDAFKNERIKGKIVNKDILENGNLGILVEDESTGSIYFVEFRTEKVPLTLDNMFGIVDEPYRKKNQYLNHLLAPNRYIDMAASYTKGPKKAAYHIYSVRNNYRH